MDNMIVRKVVDYVGAYGIATGRRSNLATSRRMVPNQQGRENYQHATHGRGGPQPLPHSESPPSQNERFT